MATYGVPSRRQGDNNSGKWEEYPARDEDTMQAAHPHEVELGVEREDEQPEDTGYVEEPPPAHGDKEVLENDTCVGGGERVKGRVGRG